MRSARPLIAATALIAACNSPGEIAVTFEGSFPPTAETALIYAVHDTSCGCVCGACAELCGERPCEVTCDSPRCPIDELSGVTLAPGPGEWALVFDFYDRDGALVGSACTDLVINTDGESSSEVAPIALCP